MAWSTRLPAIMAMALLRLAVGKRGEIISGPALSTETQAPLFLCLASDWREIWAVLQGCVVSEFTSHLNLISCLMISWPSRRSSCFVMYRAFW